MKLEDIKTGQTLSGVRYGENVTVVSVQHLGEDSVMLTFRSSRGPEEVMLGRGDETGLVEANPDGRPFSADAAEFRLAAEAKRITLAASWDPMIAVATSAIDPLPHQIRAVYGELLPRTPLRFLLADDPGAGKTIMAGLFIKELMLRGDVERCLIVTPGGLVEQWQDELSERFGLRFDLLGHDLMDTITPSSMLDRHPHLIARMDQLARNEDWLAALRESEWDLVVVDEAHRMSAHYFGEKLNRSRRFELGELLAQQTRHLLLMTATPHAGKNEDFRLFLSLLDPDRYVGRGDSFVDTTGVMRRMIKEDLLTFEGRRLFPERRAETVPYVLTDAEQDLYDSVSTYVRTEMNRADKLDDKRRSTVGFALTVLQRRLASSPEAIFQSLRRRADRLRRRRDDLAAGRLPVDDVTLVQEEWDDEEVSADEWESLQDVVVDAATSARTVAELDSELAALDVLVEQARSVRASQTDRKWNELRRIFSEEALDAASGDKIIIFTEHRDTLDYLALRLRTLLGRVDAVEVIHGGVRRPERRRITEEFTKNPSCRVLLATDAAGEGLNLQAAHLMVNYDLPWNPNRIEQRFGRVHRIGQREVCRLWNLVAENTREGDVFTTLLAKIEQQRKAYGGKVFDVLGESFAEVPLRKLLIDAIRYGDRPEVRAEMERVIDAQAGDGIDELLENNALANDVLASRELDELRRLMDEARARRLQPHFIERAFTGGFEAFGGHLARREGGRYEIRNVPVALRAGRRPVARAYARVAFDLAEVEGRPKADLLAPGHALHDAVMSAVLQRFGTSLDAGAAFVSPDIDQPSLFLGMVQEIRDGHGREPLERHLEFVLMGQDGTPQEAGLAPYLGWDVAPDDALDGMDLTWVAGAEQTAVRWVAGGPGARHLTEVRERRHAELERQLAAVTNRLVHETNRLGFEAAKASCKESRGEKVRESYDSLIRRSGELMARLAVRRDENARQREVRATLPRVVMAALVLPLERVDPAAAAHARETKRVERRAVDKVMAAERALGRTPMEQPFNNPGFDILSEVPGGDPIRIEVKGRILDSKTFEVTAPEILCGKNSAPRYRLALVSVHPDGFEGDEVRYVADPFRSTDLGDFHATRVHADWKKTWAQGREPF